MAARNQRVRSLDGLRGIAALVVVVHHALLASVPVLAAVYLTRRPHLNAVEWALTRTPLHILWAGPEFVIVFFVLSGFVLTLPALKGLELAAYYPSRLLRLYLPVAGALLLAVAWRVAVAHHTPPGASWWLSDHMAGASLAEVARIGTLMLNVGSPRSGLTVLWSLHWEVIFSLALPLVLLLVRRGRAEILLAGCLLISVASRQAWVHYFTPFVVGAVLASERDRIDQLPRSRWLTAGLAGTVLLGLTADWWLGQSRIAGHLADTGVLVGATAAVVLALTWRRPFERQPVRWAGSRSYSLYLVHEPVIVCTALLFHSWPVVLLVAIPAALAVSEAFYRAVEHPAHLTARSVRTRIANRAPAPVEAFPDLPLHPSATAERPYVLLQLSNGESRQWANK